MTQCAARHNKTIPCDGEYVPSEGCCLRRAALFDIWIAEFGGHRASSFEDPSADPDKLRRWKRAQSLTVEKAEALLNR